MSKEPLVYEPDIDNKIERFKAILEGHERAEVIVQKYIVHGTPYIFKNDEDKYFDLKREIAANFSEHYNNIHMVGSAKLGFSIAPKKLWKPFTIESDIDIVIVSTKLFENLWESLHEFNIGLTSRTRDEDITYKRFLDYFFKGWIRPDLFPFEYPAKNDWFDFFKSISYSKYGPQKITGALYHSFNFFEKYHVKNIEKLKIGNN
jgi:predicted nucleotidyltransferase